MEKKSGVLSTLLGIQKPDGQPYFHIEYLMDHVFKLSQEEKEENKKYWIKEGAAGAGTAEGGGEGGEGGGPGGPEGPGEMGAQAGPEAGGGAQAGPEAGGGAQAGPEAGGGEAQGGAPEGSEFEF